MIISYVTEYPGRTGTFLHYMVYMVGKVTQSREN